MTHPTTITAQPGVPFVDYEREFDASPAAVYRAHIDPTLYGQWLNVDVETLEATEGGRWKYSFGASDMRMSFWGVFHTVEANVLLIQTFEFSLAPGQVGLTITRFEEVDGRTRMSAHEIYSSVETRDAALASGMEHGVREGYNRLDELLAGSRAASSRT